jgi:hypothetical protein
MFNVIAIFVLGMLIGMNTEYQRAMACFNQSKLSESLESFERAAVQSPDDWELWRDFGSALAHVGKVERCVACFDRSLELNNVAATRLRKGCMLLLNGRWEQGWRDYESRLSPGRQVPWWDGDPVETLGVIGEQGWGDRFQFMRYLIPAQQRCKGLRLTEGKADAYTAMGSLPLALKLFDPADSPRAPYIDPDERLVEQWNPKLSSIDGFRVGIAWQGNPNYPDEHLRAVPVDCFARLGTIPGVSLVSLQKGAEPGVERIRTLGPGFDNGPVRFADTRAVATLLDLIITSDTSIAHVAGALGRPVWIAISAIPEWRWGLKGEATPWYPNMRLFRQERLGDWREVFDRIAMNLTALRGSYG